MGCNEDAFAANVYYHKQCNEDAFAANVYYHKQCNEDAFAANVYYHKQCNEDAFAANVYYHKQCNEDAFAANVYYHKQCNEDAFAANVYYHKQCYNMFTSILPSSNYPADYELTEVHSQVVSLFLRNRERKIIRDQDAFLLSELRNDCLGMSADFGLDGCPQALRHTYRIKEILITHFGERIQFSSVHCSTFI